MVKFLRNQKLLLVVMVVVLVFTSLQFYRVSTYQRFFMDYQNDTFVVVLPHGKYLAISTFDDVIDDRVSNTAKPFESGARKQVATEGQDILLSNKSFIEDWNESGMNKFTRMERLSADTISLSMDIQSPDSNVEELEDAYYYIQVNYSGQGELDLTTNPITWTDGLCTMEFKPVADYGYDTIAEGRAMRIYQPYQESMNFTQDIKISCSI